MGFTHLLKLRTRVFELYRMKQGVVISGRKNRRLTQRHVEILTLAKLGYSNIKIGSELGISPQTVRNHLELIYARLQATNRVDAVVKALRQHYIQLGGRKGARNV